ncbi:MAG: class I SAM-dependent methyltransferase [Gammaproteobacteria bacterium]
MSDAEPLPAALFERVDTGPDAEFYLLPRLVQHLDEATIAALSAFYAECLSPGADVLDLMSSWVSHLPPTPPLGRVAGLGMNADELAKNPRLDDFSVHDLNADPMLPYADGSFDAVLNAVSIQYLVRPLDVFAEIARVLRPGGLAVVAMSHRCFPTKAIRAFHAAGADDRMALVAEYFRRAGGFEEPVALDRSPAGADPLWLVTARTVSA